MKKLCAIILAVVICASMIMVGVSAKEPLNQYDIREMKWLISQALSFGDQMRELIPQWYIWLEEYNYFHTVKLPLRYMEIDGMYYHELHENLLPGGSYDNLPNYVNEFFTEGVTKRAVSQAYMDNSHPLFITAEDGRIYFASPESQVHYYGCLAGELEKVPDTLEIIEANTDYATGRIRISVLDFSSWNDAKDTWIECKFIRTAKGWRIDQSQFTDMIISMDFNETPTPADPPESPSTSDSAVGRFVLLPVLALACLAPLPLVRKKRHRA